METNLGRVVLVVSLGLCIGPLAGCPVSDQCSKCGLECEVSTTTPVAWTEPSALGSPEQLFSSFAGTCQAPFQWDASGWVSTLTVLPPQGQSTLTVTVALDPASARLVTYTSEGCSDKLQIDGTATLDLPEQANLLCDELGIDTISAGNAIGWAMECYEKGILTKDDTDGLELKFGNIEATFAMIEKIARREGFGALLAEGVKRAAAKVGKGSEKFAIHVKGMEQSAYATHNATAMLLAYMTCDVGAHHNRSWAITYDLQVGRDLVVPEKVARIIWLQNFRPMFDVLGSCRLQWVELGIDRDLYVPLIEAITGIHRTWADLEATGERIWNLTRQYWIRENEGFGRGWDQPSPRFYTEPPATGATAGQITKPEDVQRLLDMYYEQRGWDNNGHIKPETLERLKLKEFAVH